MSTPASILVYGRDPHLIETRKLLLQSAGFQVFATMKPADFKQTASTQPIDLFIFCHTLSPEECQHALAASHELQPKTKNLLLTATTSNWAPGNHDRVLSVFEGPRALLATVEALSRSGVSQSSV